MNQPIDVVLINLGTPKAPTRIEIMRYLREFLLDYKVIDIRNPWRWLLIHSVFLPFRSKKTTQAYQQIWTAQGSPLLVYSQQLRDELQNKLGDSYRVNLAMRYGRPSLSEVLKPILEQSHKMILLPLYPQYAVASTGTALDKAFQVISAASHIPALTLINQFYHHPAFIRAYTSLMHKKLLNLTYDFILFSYHGLPLRQIKSSKCHSRGCDRVSGCSILDQPSTCYRQQCFQTTHLLADALQLSSSQYQTSFQSRLGKLPWIQPYTDQVLPELIARGIRDLAVVTPSFVTDCLETLEEIGIRLRREWHALGGKQLHLIPCLNNHPEWVLALKEIITA